MAFQGIFNSIKNEVKKEFIKQINPGGSSDAGGSGSGSGGGFSVVSSVLDLIGGKGGAGGSSGGGGGGGGAGLKLLLGILQKNGGMLPTQIQGMLPGILKVAEMFGHGIGDQAPRTEQKPDGEFIDEFIKTLISGRKIFGGGGTDKVKELTKIGKHGGTKFTGGGTAEGVQDYEAIKAQCLAEGALFEDDVFPPVDSSVFYSSSSRRQIYWKRPQDISSNPVFVSDGATRFDVMQGELGDCWLLAAVANLTMNEAMLQQIVLPDNSFDDGYCGIFHFRFWQYGKWVEVVVDDLLPCDGSGKLLFMHSEDTNEFWSALLEKAYAKLYGSYEALKGGTTTEALVDFTGGVIEMYDVQDAPSNLYKIMLKAWDHSSFMGCSIEPDPRTVEAVTPEGLVRGHAYSITDVKLIEIETPRVSGKVPLLRIRNPWGNEMEWKGAWSDGSEEWQFVQDETKEDICLAFDADGEFWMSFKDFATHFQRLEICNLSANSLDEGVDAGKQKWEMSIFEGVWEGPSAGGCRNHLETFASNPQYIIELTDADDDDDVCTVIVALMQKNRRAMRKEGAECLTIGFAVYHINDPSNMPQPLPVSFFKYNASVARSPTFINLREVSCRFTLPPGTYCIVPSTFDPGEEGEFIIRVFSEANVNMTQMEGEQGDDY